MAKKRKSTKNTVFRGMWRSAGVRWRVMFGIMGLFILLNFAVIGLSTWYKWTLRDQPTIVGATFIPRYANYFGVNPQETLHAILNDLGVKNVRLVSYWNEYEQTPGQYDFTNLDWQFDMAQEAGAKVSLSIGLRQPRWPECHLPAWAVGKPMSYWEPKLASYTTIVMERYRNHPALENYQLENEFFLKAFGDCPDHTRERLVALYDLAKRVDPDHPIIVTRSNNALGWPVNAPTPDKYGVSVYKRVWDKTITKRYFEYPFPPQFYGALGAMSKITQGKELFIHELQTEAWGPTDILNLSIEEQNYTMDAYKLSERIDYGVESGLKRLDLWGPEYWYWRMMRKDDPSLWLSAKNKINQHSTAAKPTDECGFVLSASTVCPLY